MKDYCNLHVHTTFSLMHSLIKPSELFNKVKELGQTSVAVADYGTMSGAWDCLKYSKAAGVKLIIGCEFYFAENLEDTDTRLRHVVLLAKNQTGYKNLLGLNKLANDNNVINFSKVIPRIDWEMLKEYSDGLICITGGGGGILGHLINTRRVAEAKEDARRLKDIFGDNLGLEIQPNALRRNTNAYNDYEDQSLVNNTLIKFGKELDIRVVAAVDSHYVVKEQADSHDVMLAITSGQPVKSGSRLRYNIDNCNGEFYLKTRDEVVTFFSRLYPKQAEEFCDNSLYFSNLCEEPDWIDPKYSNPSGKELPVFPVEDEPDYNLFVSEKEQLINSINNKELKDDELYLRWKVGKLFNEAIQNNRFPSDRLDEYRSRIEEELDVMEYHGFSSYMLIVADYLDWARKNGIPIGPGRGCLTADTKVLTSKGFKNLDKIVIGDKVYTHTGKLRNVTNVFKYNVDEKLVKIYTENSFGGMTLTSDHEVYAAKSNLPAVKLSPKWIQAGELEKDDVVFTIKPIRNIKNRFDQIDMNHYSFMSGFNSDVAKEDDKSWILKSRTVFQSEKRYVEFDSKLLYTLGCFIGKGSVKSTKNCIVIDFNNKKSIEKVKDFVNSYSISHNIYCNDTGYRMIIHSSALYQLFSERYLKNFKSNGLPVFFRELPDDLLESLINGIFDNNYHFYNSNISSYCSSARVACDIKEALIYLNIPSNVEKDAKNSKITRANIYDVSSMYQSKITDIDVSDDKYVYDIMVDKDRSYLTSNCVVHNSVGGSMLAYILNIHIADPIKYKLVFARFHNKEKKNFPDIDVDIATSGRHLVLDYVNNKYGKDKVAHVSNISTMTPKVYARDIARAFQYGGDRKTAVAIGTVIADSIPKEVTTIKGAFEHSAHFSELANKYTELRLHADNLGGKAKAWSTHAAGVIIGSRSLHNIVPIRKDKDGNYAIEYDKDRSEENGLVKMDFLGLETLDIIKNTIDMIKASGKPDPKFDFDTYDQKTYDLICEGNVFGVFQLGESSGTRDLCIKVKPKSIQDLAMINALARPGAKDIRADFVSARNGEKKVELLHPNLERAFLDTYGYPLFEECLIYLTHDVAGWDLHRADALRKFTKSKGKYPEKAKVLRESLIKDSIANNVDGVIAARIWDEIVESFGNYAFNLAHATLYSMISYQSAYLKANYPLEFLTACLRSEVNSNKKDSTIRRVKYKEEIRKHKVDIIPPDINKSELSYTIVDNNTLLTGLDALKFIGKDSIPEIIKHRPFDSFDDFLSKVDGRKVKVQSVQALAAAGCLDGFGLTRKQIFLYASDYKKKLQLYQKRKNKTGFNYPWPKENDWTIPEKYALEVFYLGEGLSTDLPSIYPGFFSRGGANFEQLTNKYPPMEDVKNIYMKQSDGYLEAIVKTVFEFKVKNEKSKIFGQVMARIGLQDIHGNTMNMTCFPDKLKVFYDRLRQITGGKVKLEPGIVVHVTGALSWYEGEMSIIFDDLVKCKGIPARPNDLEHKKVSMKLAKEASEEKISEVSAEDVLQDIEDQLTEEGLVCLDDDDEFIDGFN